MLLATTGAMAAAAAVPATTMAAAVAATTMASATAVASTTMAAVLVAATTIAAAVAAKTMAGRNCSGDFNLKRRPLAFLFTIYVPLPKVSGPQISSANRKLATLRT
jgi:hypothetical protein